MKTWRMLLSGLVLLALGASIFLNLMLFRRAKQYYFELNHTRLDPLGIDFYPTTAKEDEFQQVRVVFFGDSRSAQWPSPIMEGELADYKFINRGISSQTSVQSFLRFAEHVGPLKPNVVVVQVGVNDLKTVALFPDRRDAIVANCQENIKGIVAAAKAMGAVVIVSTVFPVGQVPLERQIFWSDDIAIAVQQVNAYIATLADDQTLVLDAFSLLANQQGLVASEYSSDELHLNDRGYEVLNQKLSELLQSLKPSKNP
jgi:lysophospholipase L1-like esterase